MLTSQSLQPSQGDQVEAKRIRGQRQLSPGDPHRHIKQGQLPSPITHKESTGTDDDHHHKEGTVTPPPQSQAKFSQARNGLSSPPSDKQSDTQAFTQQSQFVFPPQARSYAVDDEEGQQVWGYLVPLDDQAGDVMVLRQRAACPVPENIIGPKSGTEKVSKHEYQKQEEHYESEKAENGITAGGYLIGRHRECGKLHSILTDHTWRLTFHRSSTALEHRLEPTLPDIRGEEGRRPCRSSRGSVWERHVRQRFSRRPKQATRTEGW